ncbi:hypothetical protein [Brumimicrobium aurantiacum]|uniref:YolD-like family protein n=1 Tax=Brumimicrobium aurantiacum TaxID=1737063 RepID=A0A3E1EXU0_9FLAO|nr:hypothetical protein [Brumimicrobium aurantiacum]RFC54376.1 hypothetical protein DXU93_08085 [Brumimicrobium aurantiacum]
MQEVVKTKPQIIEKELIPQLKFPKELSHVQQEGLMEKLIEATKLGNIDHVKVAIVFEDSEGVKQVETTIWAAGLNYICLKGGMWLPIANIIKIETL